jgi:DNA-directed RNA polymerase specialized sigma24 family protein
MEDRGRFEALVSPLLQPAFRLAYGMLGDRSAAEDAIQEASLRAWRKLDNL